MKKWVKSLLSILLVTVLVFSLGGCGGDTQDRLSARTERKIKKAYLEYCENDSSKLKDVKINHYLGNYDGSVAVMIEGNLITIAILPGFRIAEMLFLYSREVITIYNNGHIYELPEAYKLGLLSNDDLEKLFNRYYALFPELHPDKVDLKDWYIMG